MQIRIGLRVYEVTAEGSQGPEWLGKFYNNVCKCKISQTNSAPSVARFARGKPRGPGPVYYFHGRGREE